MRKNLLAMICNEHGNVADRKYVSTLAEALKWAQNFSELGNYEIVVFKTTEDKPLLRFGPCKRSMVIREQWQGILCGFEHVQGRDSTFARRSE